MPNTAVTRFAPSPTGHLHVGGARTALFNWALARRAGGRFLLRVEDTDRARSSEEASRGILEDLAWLGIDWDEGPVWQGAEAKLGGDPRGVGPFFQSQRLAQYEAVWDQMLDADLAYPAFETPEDLEARRREARHAKQAFRYHRAAGFDRARALDRMREEPHVLRFRMPEEPIHVVDVVLGEIAFSEELLDDFIVRKRDGFPTYHFAVVVDDERMGVTHVLRGQEHLNNTPRHVALQRALGFRKPVYLHVPLIFNPDGSKMSKRDKDKAAREALRETLAGGADALRSELEGALGRERLEHWLRDKRSQLEPEELGGLATRLGLELPSIEVEDFRRAGILPEVLCNFIALLGWNPGIKESDGRDLERFDREFLSSHFDPVRIGKSNARFDREKLEAFNQDAIAGMPTEQFVEHWYDWCLRYDPDALAALGDDERRSRFVAAMQIRSKTLADPTRRNGPGAFALLADDQLEFDTAAVEKILRRGDPNGLERLRELEGILRGLPRFEPETIEAAVRSYCEERGVGLGKAAQPLRVALAGRAVSPPLGDTLAILGRDTALRRIDRCLERFS